MGLFGFLRKKEPPVRLRVDEVEGWLKSYQDSLGLDHHFSVFLSEMRQHAKHVMERLDILSEARLMNDRVDPRARQIMEGHRKQFVKRMSDFVEGIDIPKEYERISSFAESFSDDLDRLSADTQRNLFVLKEFFEKEASGVGKVVGQMDRSISDLRSTFERLGKERVDAAYARLREYHGVLARREELERALEEERSRLAEPSEKLERINRRIAELESSRGYHAIHETEGELEEVSASLAKARDAVRRATSSLMKPLQKYAHRHPEADLKGYAKHFVDGLLADDDLTVVKHLEGLGKELEGLDLKGPQVEKARKALAKTSVSWLNTQRKKVSGLVAKERSLRERLGKDTTRLLIDEQRRWEQATKEHLSELEKNVSMIEGELERLSPRLALQRVRDALRGLKDDVELEP